MTFKSVFCQIKSFICFEIPLQSFEKLDFVDTNYGFNGGFFEMAQFWDFLCRLKNILNDSSKQKGFI